MAALDSLPDDLLRQIIASCGDGHKAAPYAVPQLKAVNGLGSLCKDVLQQLYRLRPVVRVHVRSLAVAQHLADGPWRIVLLFSGEPTADVVEQARQGRVHSIHAKAARLAPAVAKRVVPELLGAGCSLLELRLDGVKLNFSWTATFGEATLLKAWPTESRYVVAVQFRRSWGARHHGHCATTPLLDSPLLRLGSPQGESEGEGGGEKEEEKEGGCCSRAFARPKHRRLDRAAAVGRRPRLAQPQPKAGPSSASSGPHPAPCIPHPASCAVRCAVCCAVRTALCAFLCS